MKVTRTWQFWLWDEVGARVLTLSAQASRELGAGAAQLRVTPQDRLELRAGPGEKVFLNDVQLTLAAELRAGDLVRVGVAQGVVLGHTPPPPPAPPPRWTRGQVDSRLEEALLRGDPVSFALVHVRGAGGRLSGPALEALWPAWGAARLGPQTFLAVSLGSGADPAQLQAALGGADAVAVGMGQSGVDGSSADELREAAVERLAVRADAWWPEMPIALDPAMVRLAGFVERTASGARPVVFEGEPGSGRGLWARRLHLLSGRRAAGLRAVDCRWGLGRARAALRRAAPGGAVLLCDLDALGDDAARTLWEAAPRGSRVLATARRTPEGIAGRCAVAPLPALRDRPSEVLPLATQALEQARWWIGRRNLSFGGEARRSLLDRAWAGNVRELRNAVWLAALSAESDEIRVENLPPVAEPRTVPGDGNDADLRSTLREAEKDVLLGALSRTRWNVTQAARELGLPRRTVVYRMARLGLRRPA
jgi:hypothetical protein